MRSNRMWAIAIVTALVSASGGSAMSAQDKYTVKVPGGLAFSEFKGYESWQLISVSQNGPAARRDPRQSRDDRRLQGRHSRQRQAVPRRLQDGEDPLEPETRCETFPAATVPGTLHDVDFMVKDSKRFADSGGWGWAVFKYDAASDTFTPGTTADKPPQGNDAKCGFGCHTIVKTERLRLHRLRNALNR